MTPAAVTSRRRLAYPKSRCRERRRDCEMDADVIVVGAGLAGLVAAHELTRRGRTVALLDQENAANLGGQAFWSFGGLFLVDSPEQRRMGIKDSLELAWSDWQRQRRSSTARRRGRLGGRAGRAPTWTSRRGRSGPSCATTGSRFLPDRRLGRARRPARRRARQLGAPLPRHLGDRHRGGRAVRATRRWRPPTRGLVTFRHRHRVDELVVERRRGHRCARDRARTGRRRRAECRPTARWSASSTCARRPSSSRPAGSAPTTTWSGATGRERLGTPPRTMVTGVPAYVDGRMLAIAAGAGARLVNRDRMWHYTEGVQNWDPIWPEARHPDPAGSVVAVVRRAGPAAARAVPSRATTRSARCDCAPRPRCRLRPLVVRPDADDHREGVRAVGFGAEPRHHRQGPHGVPARAAVRQGRAGAGGGFKDHGADFVVADTLDELVAEMNALTDEPLLDVGHRPARRSRRATAAGQPVSARTPSSRASATHAATRRPARPQAAAAPLLDPDAGPLIAVQLHILTRKTLGGIETDLDSRGSGRRAADRRPLRRRRGRRVRRWRRSRVQRPGGHVPRRLHLLRPRRRTGARRGALNNPGTR